MTQTVAFPVISLSLLLLVIAGIVIGRMQNDSQVFKYTMGTSLAVLALGLFVLGNFDFSQNTLQFEEHATAGKLTWHVGLDSLNILFYLLTLLISPLTLLFLRSEGQNKVRMSGVLIYEAVLIAAFASQHLFMFWCLLLLELLPLHMVSGLWKTKNHSATKLLIRYWALMLVLILSAMIVLTYYGENSASLGFILLFFGLAVRLPAFPFHGWLPVMVSQGNTFAAFSLIAGLKIGIYGLYRFVLPLLADIPESWGGFVLSLALFGIYYGALLALMQINLQRLLAFAVVSHNGVLLIGLINSNDQTLSGSLLLSIAFGLASIGMILSTGFIRSKTGTTFIPRLGNLFENNTFSAILFLLAALSTMAIPGTPGYNAAHLLLEGLIEASGWKSAIAILIGNVLAAAFLLRAFQQVYIASPRRAILHKLHNKKHILQGETLICCVLCALILLAGFYPLAELLGNT